MNSEPQKPTRMQLTLPLVTVILICGMFSAYFSVIGWRQHRNITTNRFDLGNMSQVVWNTAHGRIFQFTDPYGTATVSRFAYHADPILIAFAPLYWIWADPRMLIIAQAIIVAFGGYVMFLIGRHKLNNPWAGATLAFAFLLYPTLQHAVLFDFHPLTLAATFALVMAYGIISHRWRIFLVGAILLMLSKEELALIVISVAVWYWIREKKLLSRWGYAALISVAYFLLIFFVVMPYAGRAAAGGYGSIHNTGERSTTREVIAHAIRNPGETWSRLAQPTSKQLTLGLLLPLAGLPLASPLWLLAAWPELSLPILDPRLGTRTLIYHYHAVTSALILVSAAFGMSAIARRYRKWTSPSTRMQKIPVYPVLCIGLLGATIIGSILYSPMPYARMKNLHGYAFSSRAPLIWNTLHAIPAHASISATNTLGAQVSERKQVYFFPHGIEQADYIAILLAKPESSEWNNNHREAEAVAQDKRFEQIISQGNFSVYRRISN